MKKEWSKLLKKETREVEIEQDEVESIDMEAMSVVKLSETIGDTFNPWSLEECVRVNETKIKQLKSRIRTILKKFQESVTEETLKVHYLQASLAKQVE